MPTAYSQLLGREVDTASEEWRHETECRWLLTAKPTRTDKHLYLYGVTDREALFTYDKEGHHVLREDYAKHWQVKNPLMKWRGIAATDRILEDAKRLYTLSQPTRESA